MKQGWEITKLGVIGELKYGYTEKASLQKNGPKFLRITDIQDDFVNWSMVPYCKCNDSEYEKYKLEINDIVFARTGATTGKSFLIENLEEASVFASYLIRLRIENKGIYPRYLMYFFKTEYYWGIINQGISGSAQGGFNASKLAELSLFYPQLSEQERIVGILDNVFAKIEALQANARHNLQNAKDLFQASLKQELTPKQGWKTNKLRDISEYFNGLTYTPKDVSDDGVIVLRSSNIQNEKLDFSDIVRVNAKVKDKLFVNEGDILMCSRNGSKHLVGKTAPILDIKEPMTFGTFMMIIRSGYNPYLLWFFKTDEFKKQISGGENTMINQVTRYMLDEITLPFPSITEQQAIVEKLEALSERCRAMEDNYRQTIAACDHLKQALLKKAFNGEL